MKWLHKEFEKIEGNFKYDVYKWAILALWNVTPFSALIISKYNEMPWFVFLSAAWLIFAVIIFVAFLYYKFTKTNSRPHEIATPTQFQTENVEGNLNVELNSEPIIKCLEIDTALITVDENNVWSNSKTGDCAILVKFGNTKAKSDRLPRVTARIKYYNEKGGLIHTTYHGIWIGVEKFAWFNNYSTQTLVIGIVESGGLTIHGRELGREFTGELMLNLNRLKIEIQLIDRTGWTSTYEIDLEFDENGFPSKSEFL